MRFFILLLFFVLRGLWAQNSVFSGYPDQWLGDTGLFVRQPVGLKSAGNPSSETIGLWKKLAENDYQDMEFTVRLDFALSTTNYLRWIVAADSVYPFYKNALQVKWNASGKNLLLQKISGSTTTTLITGKTGRLVAGTQTRVRIVFRNDKVELYSDTSTANMYEKEGEALVQPLEGSWCGLLFTHTATRADKLNLLEWRYLPKPIRIQEWTMPAPDSLLIRFSEVADTNSTPYIVSPIAKTVSWKSETQLLLVLRNAMKPDVKAWLEIQGLVKKGEIEASADSVEIVWKRQWSYHEVRITELMPDPADEAPEYVEVFNSCQDTLRLSRWKFCDATSCAVIPDTVLLPGQFLVLSTSEQYLKVPSFPSLNNGGDSLTLITGEGILIDRVQYESSWWKGISQKNRAMELLDLRSICEGKMLWAACSHEGGTPGNRNSQHLDSMDVELRAVLERDQRLTLMTSQPMKTGNGNVQVDGMWYRGVFSDEHRWKSDDVVPIKNLPALIAFDLKTSCSSKGLSTIPVDVLARPSEGDLRITEVLFNPIPYGKDFVEIENVSDKNLLVEVVLLSNGRDTSFFAWNNVLRTSERILWAEDSSLIQQQYSTCETHWWEGDLPTLADDAGTIVLKTDSVPQDEIRYEEGFHSSLLSDKEGVSLERIQYNGPAEYQWMSCSSGARPGCDPPVIELNEGKPGTLYCSTDILSPDGDGRDDALVLAWMGEEMMVKATLRVYSLSGVLQKELLSHHLWQRGQPVMWDGEGAKGILAPDWYVVELLYEDEKEIRKERKLVALIGN